jgi:hypothetical protein
VARIPIGDWSDLGAGAPRREVTIMVVDGMGNDLNITFDWEDSESFWMNVYRIADWLGFGGNHD